MSFIVTRDDLKLSDSPYGHLWFKQDSPPRVFQTQDEAEEAVDHALEAAEKEWLYRGEYRIVELPPPIPIIKNGRFKGIFCCDKPMTQAYDPMINVHRFRCMNCGQMEVATDQVLR